MRHFNSSFLPSNMNLVTLFAGMNMHDRQALVSLANAGKIRLVTRMGIGAWDPTYIPTTGERNVKFNLNQQLRKLGFSLDGKAPVTQFVVTLLTSMGYQTNTDQVATRIIKAGYKPTSIMPVIKIFTDVLGIQLSTTKTITKTVHQGQAKDKSKGNSRSSRRRRGNKSQQQVQYQYPTVATVRSALSKWTSSSAAGILQEANVVGYTIYAVDAAIDSHDKAFGARAYYAADVITMGDKFVVVSTRTNVVISQRTPFVTEVFLHDVNTPFTQNLINLVSQGIMTTKTFGIDAEKMVTSAFAKGTIYLSNMWLNRILTANAPVSEQIKATKAKVEDILTSGKKIDEIARKELSTAASSVYDDNRAIVTEQDLQLVGATSQQSQYASSLPSQGWKDQPGYTHGG